MIKKLDSTEWGGGGEELKSLSIALIPYLRNFVLVSSR